jgi:hypothetical protein
MLQKIRQNIKHMLRPQNRRVDFIVCGTQKGGTSALDAYLREHPEICMADAKEVHFFDDETIFRNMSPDYSAYHSKFSPEPSHKILGEATPIYMYWFDAPKRIWQYNPNMKLIVILRNPVDRAYSHWNMEKSRNADRLSFWEAIHLERERCRESLPFQHRVYSYVDRGFYLEQLRRLWTYFREEQVLILKNEELRNQPQETLRKVFNFLQVDPSHVVEPKDVHSLSYGSLCNIREREYLRSIYVHEIRNIESTLGWDCSNWLSD